MNFKDLQFNLGKLTANAKSQVAKNNPLQNHDTRALNLWLFEERNDLSNMKTTAYHHAETNKVFFEWVKEELTKNQENENYSQDIEDIGSALYTLLNKQVELEKQYTDRYQVYRRAIKSMRDKEKELNDLKEKKQSISERIQHLKKSNPSSKKINELEKELEELKYTHEQENESSTDFKRFILKEAFYLRFNALQEYAEKTAMIAGFGKYLVDLLDLQNQEAGSGESSDMVLMDALLTVDGWQSSDQRHTLTKEDELLFNHHGDDATLLTDHDLVPEKKKKDDKTVKPVEEEEEFNEKAANNYYHQLYRHVSQQKKAICSHRSYAEFQNQFTNNNPNSIIPPPSPSETITNAKDDNENEKHNDLLPPPAYSKNENIITTTDEKKK